MTSDSAYVVGHFTKKPTPLARFLPAIPEGMAASWLESRFADRNVNERPWILDPFGVSPRLIREIAETGYRVLVASNNPVARFIIEMTANPPKESQLRSALSELAASYRGEERIEPHVKSLYETECAKCSNKIQVEAFLWERSESNPYAKIYTCPFCGDSGESPTDSKDIGLASRFSTGGLHRARALERIVAFDDPDRQHAEEAIDSYLPRAIYILFTLINKLEAFSTNRNLITALLLSACDQANSLWPHPSQRSRPKLLTIPTHFRENNIWMLLEKAIEQWAAGPNLVNIPVSVWPELPPQTGGICIYEGRIRELTDYQDGKNNLNGKIGAVVSAFPRPNQAFWTLSALWAGWLWGRTAAASFKSVLRRHRYDWSWHCTALFTALESTQPLLNPGTPVFGLIGEIESGLLSSTLVAANTAGFILKNIATRKSDDLAQVLWVSPGNEAEQKTIKFDQIDETIDRSTSAVFSYLKIRKEPSIFLHILACSFMDIAKNFKFANTPENSMWELHSKIFNTYQKSFTFKKGFLRYGGSEYSLDVGQWWFYEDKENVFPDRGKHSERIENFSDTIEISTVNYLLKNPLVELDQLDHFICSEFTGLLTPDLPLVKTCFASYTSKPEDGTGQWSLREEDRPANRREDIKNIRLLIEKVGKRLGFQIQQGISIDPTQEKPVLWTSQKTNLGYAFFIQASALLYRNFTNLNYSPKNSFLVIPGGRSGLVDFKLKNNASLNQAVEAGWRFIKFRLIRAIAEKPDLTLDRFNSQITEDPIIKSEG
jgi:hypothetical protein